MVNAFTAMPNMPRVTISFTEQQLEWLRAQADRLGISLADLIRRMVDRQRERT